VSDDNLWAESTSPDAASSGSHQKSKPSGTHAAIAPETGDPETMVIWWAKKKLRGWLLAATATVLSGAGGLGGGYKLGSADVADLEIRVKALEEIHQKQKWMEEQAVAQEAAEQRKQIEKLLKDLQKQKVEKEGSP